MKVYSNLFDKIISPLNLFMAWEVFKADKGKKPDVVRFEYHLEENIFQLHRELKNKTYQHGPYHGFYLHDPKQRHIHKATVRDRVLHHGIDFLGYIIFPHYRLVRTKTRRRMFTQFKVKIATCRAGSVSEDSLAASLRSYLGVFSHANAIQYAEDMKNLV